VLLAAALAATFVVYRRVLDNFFWADDIVFLYEARNGTALEFLLTPWGGHLSWTRNLVFLALERLAGPRPEPFFALALATHLLNVALCFATVRAFTGSAFLGFVWATLWGTSPRNAATLTWFAVYGQMMVGTIMLALLWRAAVLASRGTAPTALDAGGAVALCAVASGCFGVGLGLGLTVPVSALLLFPRMPWNVRWTFLALLVVLPALYVLGQWLNTFAGSRELAPDTASVLAGVPDALRLTALLLGTGLAGLLAGFTAPGAVPAPVALAALGGLGALLALALATADDTHRRRLLATALLPAAIYGIIAMGRAPLADVFGGVPRVAATPRYHYTGPLALTVLLALSCAQARRWPRLAGAAGPALAVLVLSVDGFAWARGQWRYDIHASVRRRTSAMLAEVAEAAAAAPPGTTVVVPNVTFPGVGPMYAFVPTVFPRLAGLFIAFHDADSVAGRPVRFAESDAEVYAQLTADADKRIARLLVPAPPP
jgi:hypothetical protein